MTNFNSNQPQCWDKQLAMECVADDESLLREVASLFLDDSSASLRQLKIAVEDGQAKDVERIAHSIKGAASNFGAQAAVAAALALEKTGRQGALEAASAQLLQLEGELACLGAELQAYLQES